MVGYKLSVTMKSIVSVICLLFVGLGVTAQTAEELYEKSLKLYEQENYSEALTSVGKAIKNDDTQGKYYKHRGDVRQRMGKIKAAANDYAAAKKKGLETGKLYLSWGAAKLSMDDVEGALKAFDKAVELDPQNPDAHYNRGCAQYLNFDLKAAIEDYSKAIELDAEFTEAYYFRGVAKSELDQQYDGIADIEKSISLNDSLNDAYLSLAIIKYELEQYDAAIEDLNKIIGTESEYLKEAFFYRAESKYFAGDKQGACEDWNAAGELGDYEAEDHYFKFCIKGQKKTEKARRPKKGVISF